MRTQFNRALVVLLTGLALIGFTIRTAVAAPAASSTKVVGTITQLTKDKITVRDASGKDVEISLDGKNTMTLGRPSVDKQATVWYKKSKDGNLWATKIDVPEKTVNRTGANATDAAAGKVDGTIARYTQYKITVRDASKKEWEFMLDGKNTMTLGKPAADKTATVWYKKNKGNLWATKIQVNK